MTVTVVIYLDGKYVVPATVMIRSLLDNSTASVRLYVLALDLSGEQKRTMEASWDERAQVQWIDLDGSDYTERFTPVSYQSRAAYARTMIDRYVAADAERAITIDCDGIMLGDVAEIWQRTSETACVLAVPDPCLARLADDRSRFVQRFADAGDSPYFNSGIMVVDLCRWRERRISERCLDLAERHPWGALYADQTYLNLALRDDWEPLPLKWNCNARYLAVHSYPSLRNRIYPYAEVLEAQARPAFLHFLSSVKPWHDVPFHPHRDIYFAYWARTKWVDVSPRRALPPRSRLSGLVRRQRFTLGCYRQVMRERRKHALPRADVFDFLHFLFSPSARRFCV